MRVTNCRTCEAPIVWCITKAGKKMPLDADPVEDGKFYLLDEDEETPEARSVSGATLSAGVDRYTSHFASCPEASSFRGRRGNAMAAAMLLSVLIVVVGTAGVMVGIRMQDDPPPLPPGTTQLQMELGVCAASMQRTEEVLDSVLVWIGAARRGAPRGVLGLPSAPTAG